MTAIEKRFRVYFGQRLGAVWSTHQPHWVVLNLRDQDMWADAAVLCTGQLPAIDRHIELAHEYFVMDKRHVRWHIVWRSTDQILPGFGSDSAAPAMAELNQADLEVAAAIVRDFLRLLDRPFEGVDVLTTLSGISVLVAATMVGSGS